MKKAGAPSGPDTTQMIPVLCVKSRLARLDEFTANAAGSLLYSGLGINSPSVLSAWRKQETAVGLSGS